MSEFMKGTLQYDRERGVVYFHDEVKGCMLRIEGVPPVKEGRQIDIHLVHPGCEHHHEFCGDLTHVTRSGKRDPGVTCAVKLTRGVPVAP